MCKGTAPKCAIRFQFKWHECQGHSVSYRGNMRFLQIPLGASSPCIAETHRHLHPFATRPAHRFSSCVHIHVRPGFRTSPTNLVIHPWSQFGLQNTSLGNMTGPHESLPSRKKPVPYLAGTALGLWKWILIYHKKIQSTFRRERRVTVLICSQPSVEVTYISNIAAFIWTSSNWKNAPVQMCWNNVICIREMLI